MFRFNSGMGGVTCDKCNVLIDQGLSLKEYEDTWGKHGDDGDFCMKCKESNQTYQDFGNPSAIQGWSAKGGKNGKRVGSAGGKSEKSA
jgi:hypothetical protein